MTIAKIHPDNIHTHIISLVFASLFVIQKCLIWISYVKYSTIWPGAEKTKGRCCSEATARGNITSLQNLGKCGSKQALGCKTFYSWTNLFLKIYYTLRLIQPKNSEITNSEGNIFHFFKGLPLIGWCIYLKLWQDYHTMTAIRDILEEILL